VVRRREFIALFAGAAATWPRIVRAQQGAKIPRIGILSPSRSEEASPNRVTLKAFVAGSRELGYEDGQNITIERELSEANADRLRQAAAELVKHNVDVIVTLSTTAARPAKQATSLIPIVGIAMADPVDDELVASLARPGGNVTGTTFLGPELVTKRLQLLSEVVPQHSRVAVLWHPRAYSDRTMDGMVKPIHRPSHHHIELALSGVVQQPVKLWPPIPALSATDAVIPVDADDLTAHAAGHLSQLSLLVGRGLVDGRNPQVENGTFH
jgi:putative ABC transport system substrate-binding protein